MTNTYFEEMARAGKEYEEARAARKAERDEILEKYGWDSEEYAAWKEREESIKFPFTAGAMKAYRAWAFSNENSFAPLVLNDFLWESEVKDFVETLRAAEITEFLYTNQSTGLMDNMHDLVANGCEMIGLDSIVKLDIWDKPETLRAVSFRVG